MKRKEDSWKDAIIDFDSTIQDAIRILNDSSLRILLVIAPSGALIGTISDGDIRRGLLRGFQLSSPIEFVVNKDPIVVSPKISIDVVTKMMIDYQVFQIPIIDENRILKGLHLIDDIFLGKSLKNSFVIMAGGKGTRLLPKTQDIPKPMLQISGKPILEHIILRAKGQGFRKFIIAVHHLSNVIEEYFNDGRILGVEIRYLREKVPLGTAGGLSLIESIPSESLVVTNGDVITDIRYRDILEFHEQNGASATMAVQLNEWQNPFGVVQTDGFEMISYEEKPIIRSLINAGVYVLNPTTLTSIEREIPIDMPTLFEKIRAQGNKTLVYPIHEKWTDIGRHEDFERAIAEFKRFEGEQKWT